MALTNKLTELCQQQALGQVLTDWEDLTYDEILVELYAAEDDAPDHDEIVVWQQFEDWSGIELAHQIEAVYSAFEEVALSAVEETKNATNSYIEQESN